MIFLFNKWGVQSYLFDFSDSFTWDSNLLKTPWLSFTTAESCHDSRWQHINLPSFLINFRSEISPSNGTILLLQTWNSSKNSLVKASLHEKGLLLKEPFCGLLSTNKGKHIKNGFHYGSFHAYFVIIYFLLQCPSLLHGLLSLFIFPFYAFLSPVFHYPLLIPFHRSPPSDYGSIFCLNTHTQTHTNT